MVQGTASASGKSVLVTALCRIFRQAGYAVAPFKSQNMSLNAFVTPGGGEIGWAQAVQAEAAGIEPSVDMNPILLKPEEDCRSQVIVRGRPALRLTAAEYYRHRDELLAVVKESLGRLTAAYDVVVIEGAGSPAEINLRESEIVNMCVARLAGAPVLLVGDIDRGGVFASLVGTLALLDEADRQRVRGFVINKFRGDLDLLRPGLDYLEAHTGKPVLGVLPYYRDIFIPQEDSLFEEVRGQAGAAVVEVAVIRLPRLANSTDFEPLQQESGVRVRYIHDPAGLGQPDVIILPGSKSTVADLDYLWRSGLAGAVIRRAQAGTPVVGICGGFQMLGRQITDPEGVEAAGGSVTGLGLLDVVTVFRPEKTTRQVRARVLGNEGLLAGLQGEEVTGYEIHMGQTVGGGATPLLLVSQNQGDEPGYPDGAVAGNGLIWGSYLHGLFDNANLRRAFLAGLRQRKGLSSPGVSPVLGREQHYDRLADLVRHHLDMAAVYRICGLAGG
ncbi:MAG: cobyric acid synthase [Chloroflexota bacterium]